MSSINNQINTDEVHKTFIGERNMEEEDKENRHEIKHQDNQVAKQEELKKQNEQVAKLEEELKKQEERIIRLKKDNDAKDQKINELDRKLLDLNEDFSYQNLVIKDNEEVKTRLETDKLTLIKKVREQQDDIASVQETNRILNEELIYKHNQINAHKKELEKFKSEKDQLLNEIKIRDSALFSNKILFAMIVVLSAMLLVNNLSSFPLVFKSSSPAILTQSALAKTLEQEFPHQTKRLRGQIITSYKESIIDNNDPSVIMLVSDKLSRQNAKCVTQKLLRTLNDAANGAGTLNPQVLVVDTTKLQNANSEYAKEELDKDLVNIFTNLKSRVALVNTIQNIPGDAMLLFHSYGDEREMARYKGVIILLTYELKEVVSSNEERVRELESDYAKLSRFVEAKLTEEWSDSIAYDQLKPLFTRITNNIVFINNNEENCKF